MVNNGSVVAFDMEHGGDIRQAARRWNIPEDLWLDLSTGINPFAYPLPAVPASTWQQLPYEKPQLRAQARDYYGAKQLLPVSGSQQAIEQIPRLFSQLSVAVPRLGYSEHAKQWQAAGHEPTPYDDIHGLQRLVAEDWVDAVVVVNPNNPSAELIDKKLLLALAEQLAERGAWLIVDEAFMDLTPEQSLAGVSLPNLVVLRSLGKFFGLAGVRLGFVCGPQHLLAQLAQRIGLWAITGPTQWAALQALADRDWQHQTKQRLFRAAAALSQQLEETFPYARVASAGLFVSVKLPLQEAEQVFESFAAAGVLLRLFRCNDSQGLLRFGLPPEDEVSRQRLAQLLSHCQSGEVLRNSSSG